MGDDVVGEDAGAGGGRLVDRGDDLDQAVFHRHLDAEAAELAAGLHLHVAEALGVHVARMRIEGGQHAVDGRFDELGLFGLLDVIRPDLFENIAEKAQLPVRVGRGRNCARCPTARLVCDTIVAPPAPMAAPRIKRDSLRIIREPFRFAISPTRDLDRSNRRLS